MEQTYIGTNTETLTRLRESYNFKVTKLITKTFTSDSGSSEETTYVDLEITDKATGDSDTYSWNSGWPGSLEPYYGTLSINEFYIILIRESIMELVESYLEDGFEYITECAVMKYIFWHDLHLDTELSTEELNTITRSELSHIYKLDISKKIKII